MKSMNRSGSASMQKGGAVDVGIQERDNAKRILLLEFNELSPILVDKFIAEGSLPNFERLREMSVKFRTETSDEELQPWVQWTTFHLGEPQAKHGIFSLDEGHLIDGVPLWDDLSSRGYGSLVFGAMNGSTSSAEVELLPDAWASRVEPTSELFDRIHSFSSLAVQEHANPNAGPSKTRLANDLLFLARNGLRAKTSLRLVSQVVLEKVLRRDTGWKRACLFDQLLWDVFLKQWTSSEKPVGVFFANSTAFLQHRFWRFMDSSDFRIKPTERQDASYSDAIRHGYKSMDEMIGRVLDDPQLAETTIALATGLSQEANPSRMDSEPHEAYRPYDFAEILQWVGVTGVQSIEPLMTHLAWATFESEAAAKAAANQLRRATVESASAFDFEVHGERLKFWCSVLGLATEAPTLTNGLGVEVNFLEHFSLIGTSMQDGSHHPDGIFWVAQRSPGQHEPSQEVISLPLEEAKGVLLDLVEADVPVGAR